MKTNLSILMMLTILASIVAKANDVTRCTGQLEGTVVTSEVRQGPFPVTIEIEKQEGAGYVLTYAGPAYDLANQENGFKLQLDGTQVKEVAFTTGSHLSVHFGSDATATKFSLELDSDRITKQITGHLEYLDGKHVDVSGDLRCK
jgi:hypothetical protein